MTLIYYRPETYSRLSGMFENPTMESNIIDVGQVVPHICHFLYFPWVTLAILHFGPQLLSHFGYPIPTGM